MAHGPRKIECVCLCGLKKQTGLGIEEVIVLVVAPRCIGSRCGIVVGILQPIVDVAILQVGIDAKPFHQRYVGFGINTVFGLLSFVAIVFL